VVLLEHAWKQDWLCDIQQRKEDCSRGEVAETHDVDVSWVFSNIC
jgi:hypothetical protein